MLTDKISFKNFYLKKKNKNIYKDFKNLLKEKNTILESLTLNYKNSYTAKKIFKFTALPFVII